MITTNHIIILLNLLLSLTMAPQPCLLFESLVTPSGGSRGGAGGALAPPGMPELKFEKINLWAGFHVREVWHCS